MKVISFNGESEDELLRQAACPEEHFCGDRCPRCRIHNFDDPDLGCRATFRIGLNAALGLAAAACCYGAGWSVLAYNRFSYNGRRQMSFVIHDIMSKEKYGDMGAFAKKLKDMGYGEVKLVDATNGMFMSKWESTWMGLS